MAEESSAPAPIVSSVYSLTVVDRIVLFNVLSRYYEREKKSGMDSTRIMNALHRRLKLDEADEFQRVERQKQIRTETEYRRALALYTAGRSDQMPADPVPVPRGKADGPAADFSLPAKIVAAVQTAIEHEPEPGTIGWLQFGSISEKLGVLKPDPTLD